LQTFSEKWRRPLAVSSTAVACFSLARRRFVSGDVATIGSSLAARGESPPSDSFSRRAGASQ
jgi:hypothetical protein